MSKSILIIILCFFYALFNVTGAAFIKSEVSKHQLNGLLDYITFIFTIKAIIGLSFIVLSALTLFKALSLSDFSFVIPLSTGINFILTFLIGYLIFKDQLSLLNIIGLSFILLGIFLLSFKSTYVKY